MASSRWHTLILVLLLALLLTKASRECRSGLPGGFPVDDDGDWIEAYLDNRTNGGIGYDAENDVIDDAHSFHDSEAESDSVFVDDETNDDHDEGYLNDTMDEDERNRVFSEWVDSVGIQRLKTAGPGAQSFFAPFIDILPRHYTLTDTWTEEELAECQDHMLVQETDERRYSVEIEYEAGRKLLEEAGVDCSQIDFELFHWSSMTVRSRNFELNKTIGHAMVPYAELVNHAETSDTQWRERDGWFEMFGGPFKAGDEVLANYRGDFSNRHMLQDYGFIVPGNRLNWEYAFLPPFTPLYELKLDKLPLLRHHSDQSITLNYLEMHHYLQPFDVLSFFRLLRAKTVEEIMSFQAARSIHREFQAIRSCIRYVDRVLLSKPTSIEEDYELLEEDEGSIRYHLALMYRIEGKKVWLRAKRFCEALGEELLCMPPRIVKGLRYYAKVESVARFEVWDVED